MKVNIVTDNPFSQRADYETLNSLEQLREAVDDAEAEEILALGVLDKFEFAKFNEVIDLFVSKLRHGGLLTVDCLDINEMSKAIVSYRLSLKDINNFLYGLNRKCCLSVQQLTSALRERGLKIMLARIDNMYGVVKAERQ